MSKVTNDHEEACQWARSLLKEAEADPRAWIILDTETTGIPPGPIELVEIGLLWPDGTPAFGSLVRPCWTGTGMEGIPAEATRIHGITDAVVADAPTLMDVLPKLAELIHGRKIVVYNAAFDFEVLFQCLYRRYGPPYEEGKPYRYLPPYEDIDEKDEVRTKAYAWLNAASEWERAMHWYSQFVGDWNSYRRSYKWQRLPGATHGAIGDCRACLEVIKRMAGLPQ